MDVAFLLDKYFKGAQNVSIDVFDAQTLNTVYKDVINAMTSHFEIEVSVLQALSYCLYEMMDNVHIHSGKPLGTAITYYDDKQKTLRVLIADDGMGIQASLAQNKDYENITEPEALKMCLEELLMVREWDLDYILHQDWLTISVKSLSFILVLINLSPKMGILRLLRTAFGKVH